VIGYHETKLRLPTGISGIREVTLGPDGAPYVIRSNGETSEVLRIDRITQSITTVLSGAAEWNDAHIRSDGSIVVAESNAIATYSAGGQLLSRHTSGVPSGIAGLSVNDAGVIYVTATGDVDVTRSIVAFNSDGTENFATGSRRSPLLSPAAFTITKVDSLGRIISSNETADRVTVYDANGGYQFQIGVHEAGLAPGRFFGPRGVAGGTHGEIFVADQLNYRVQAFSPTGQYLFDFPTYGNFVVPTGISVSSQGEVFVTYVGGSADVRVFNQQGVLLREVGNLNFAYDIAIDPQGRVFVADYDGRVYVLDQNLNLLDELTGFFRVNSVAADSDGRIYVFDEGPEPLHVYNSDLELLYRYGSFGAEGGEGVFNYPKSVAVDAQGLIYLTHWSGRIEVYGPVDYPGGVLSVHNSVVAQNRSGGDAPDVNGEFLSESNLVGGDPLLAPLTSIDRVTEVHRPQIGSPVIDAGNNNFVATLDQLGQPRIVDGNADGMAVVDLGAVELNSGEVNGRKFLDDNRNGKFDAGEIAIPGATIYADLNHNGRIDITEPWTTTREDDASTPLDEAGTYTLSALPPGEYQIREVPQFGFEPLFPLTLDATSAWTYERIAGGGDLAVDESESQFEFLALSNDLGVPSIQDDVIAFTDQTWGVFRTNGALLELLAGNSTDVIGFPPGFDSRSVGGFQQEVLLTPSGVSFALENDFGETGIFQAIAPGFVFTLAAVGTDIPRGFAGFTQVQRPAVGDQVVVFDGTGNFGQRGKYAAFPDGAVLALFDNKDNVFPLGLDALALAVSDGNVVYAADSEIRRFSLADPRVSEVLVTLATPVPGEGGTTFSGLASTVTKSFDGALHTLDDLGVLAVSGDRLAFYGQHGSGPVVDGLYARDDELRLIADTRTLLPDTGESFFRFGDYVSLTSDAIAFSGESAFGSVGVYTDFGTGLRRVVDTYDVLEGRQIADLDVGSQALTADGVVFRATFTDGSRAIYRARQRFESAYEVSIAPGQSQEGLEFGSVALDGSISGVVFDDLNGDGVFNDNEPILAGQIVFLDHNRNGQQDPNEPMTETNEDGQYEFFGIKSFESITIGVEVESGRRLTAPSDSPYLFAVLRPGEAATGFDFGTQIDTGSTGSAADGSVSGVVYDDVNGNRRRDDVADEPGLVDVTVFVDENGDGILNGGERSTTTGPDGSYTIGQLRGSRQEVRIVLPNMRTEQTSPLGNTFSTSTLRTIDSPVEVVTGDFNGDGIDDLATTINQTSEVQFFLNDGNGEFISGERVEVSAGAGSIAVGHFLGTGMGEGLVVGHRTTSSVKVLLPGPGGVFSVVDLITPQSVLPRCRSGN